MAITEVAYCTRADVQRALNFADSPRLNERVDSAVMAGARDLEGALHRKFYPETKTVEFDMPDDEHLWLYENELAAAPTLIMSGGAPMTVDFDVLLRPKSGPPYRWLEARFGGDVYWQAEGTVQNAIAITGVFHYPVKQITVTGLAAQVAAGDDTIIVLDSSRCGPGSLILLGSERLIVSDATLEQTGASLAADAGTAKSDTQLTVDDGTLINAGELLWIEGERLFVTAVAGDTVVVDRAVNASTLAGHTSGTLIYAPRELTVLRGELGTEPADHDDTVPVILLKAPSLISELNLALAINNTQQALSAYARPVGAADTQRDQVGRGVQDIMTDAMTTYGRQYRGRAI